MTNAVHYRAARGLALVVVLLMGVGVVASSQAEAQSARERARQAYNDGRLLFEQQRYAEAIAKFELADQLAPAPLLSFNIGLSYDAMGNAEQALQHYRAYLRRAPNAQNRGVVEGKINRIEGQLRAKAAAEEAARKKAAEEAAARKAAEEAAARKAAEEAARARAAEEAAAGAPAAGAPAPPPTAPPVAADPPVAEPAPAPAEELKPNPFESTGDPELDSVARIDVSGLREQRGLAGHAAGPAAGPAAASPGPVGPAGGAEAPPPPGPRPVDPGKKKAKPVYKQWWFWVIVGVSAIILIDIATTDNSNNNANRLVMPAGSPSTATAPGGLMWRF